MTRNHNYYVYIMTNWNCKVMYVGMTDNLECRTYEHKNKLTEGFTKRYNVNKLVYFEHTIDVNVAIAREKEIKKWRREKKNNLVVIQNPDWRDLSDEWETGFLPSVEMTKGEVEMTGEPVEFDGPRKQAKLLTDDAGVQRLKAKDK